MPRRPERSAPIVAGVNLVTLSFTASPVAGDAPVVRGRARERGALGVVRVRPRS